MNSNLRTTFSNYWFSLTSELFPKLGTELECITSPLEKLIRVLEFVRIEEYVDAGTGFGRPCHERGALARAFCAKTVFGMECTVDIIERLKVDSALRRICGFPRWHKIPSKSTFSRAFAEFTKHKSPICGHSDLIKNTFDDHLIGAVSRDSTAIIARERPAKSATAKEKEKAPGTTTTDTGTVNAVATPIKRGRGRPRKGTPPVVAEPKRVEIQLSQTVQQMLADLPKDCDRGSKKNAKGHTESWNGYKLHLDTSDCGVIISAITTSASVHDSQVSRPLSLSSEEKITFCYELADAAYCSDVLRADSIARNHVPLFDHNSRRSEKREFAPHEAQRYKSRTDAERSNGDLKDNYGLRQVWYRGHEKVHTHMMFAVLCLSAVQIMRLIQ